MLTFTNVEQVLKCITMIKFFYSYDYNMGNYITF